MGKSIMTRMVGIKNMHEKPKILIGWCLLERGQGRMTKLSNVMRATLMAEWQETTEKIVKLEEWLQNAIDKAPEFNAIIPIVDTELINEEEYSPKVYPKDENVQIPMEVMNNTRYGRDWLFEKCSLIPSAFKTEELCEQILRILSSPIERMESDLLDLLGYESIELVFELVSHREKLLTACKGNHKFQTLTNFPISEPSKLPGQSVILNTTASKQAAKEYQRLRSKGILPEEEEEEAQGEKAIVIKDLLPIFGVTNEHYELPNVFVKRKASQPVKSGKFALPEGTLHQDFADYEEFVIPHTTDSQNLWPIQLMKINEMDSFLQQGFLGYSSLNKMQSAVFSIAHNTNENMLVCAPTGAGKTDVAMLTILKTVRDHHRLLDVGDREGFMISKDEFKIVYIAPMKALAAEITLKFATRLKPFGLKVREYTGDMQLSRREVQETQVIVTTPEKWDVITRKGQGDVDLVQKVKLLIIDEVHLLQDDRGSVIETLVARTLREVEISQRLVRIIGLSATLPNFVDVALFLRVDIYTGMFVFGETFRPVPLTQRFLGVKGRSTSTVMESMSRICFEKCREFVEDGHQVMIFVHSRNDTVKTARAMSRQATELGVQGLFKVDDTSDSSITTTSPPKHSQAMKMLGKSRNRELQTLVPLGFAFHHAGMLRSDRSLVEQLFSQGHVRVLVCTATLAWGVNLPAHAVIIKGTQVYDSQKGDFVQLGVLDVLQIFGRAGRPQFETHGEGIILTRHEHMTRYIGAIMSQVPIESQFLNHLAENLNAEISLGTVSNLNEAIAWLKYSYLYIRMQRNPTAYGITPKELGRDPDLQERLENICRQTVLQLRACGMVAFDPEDNFGTLRIRDIGRIASNFYLTRGTVEIFGKGLSPGMSEEEILALASSAEEFANLRVREEELRELDALRDGAPLRLRHDTTTAPGKTSLLIMAHISRYPLDTFSLVSDGNYVTQNGGRILRALFEMVRAQGWMATSLRCLTLCRSFERRIWPLQHPLSQFEKLNVEVLQTLDKIQKVASMSSLHEMTQSELAALIGSPRAGNLVWTLIRCFPQLKLSAKLRPVTREVIRVDLTIIPEYDYDESFQGGADLWWLFVENPLIPHYLHCEEFVISKKQVRVSRQVSFFIPLKTPIPSQLYIRAVSDRWLQGETCLPISMEGIILPEEQAATTTLTNLLPLRPLPITALNDICLESLYGDQFIFFNTIQTQLFHTLYHGKESLMIGAPTGSGKTVMAELALWNAKRSYPDKRIVYVAPLKALVKERLADWEGRLSPLGLKVIESSGDSSPNASILKMADVIITTPEKWDSLTRGNSSLATSTSLLILDEIHLLGSDRGHVLEILIARNRRGSFTKPRILGLSTALASAGDVGIWLGLESQNLYNFRPSVRPVPLEVRIEGFAGRHYCPRMATMNKPAYMAILQHSSDKPVLIFVSSRRQTRLTANALISLCANDNAPRCFVRCSEDELKWSLDNVKDVSLKHSLSFGITLHHAGLSETDRRISETLFASGKVQIMVATSTLAWGLNFPAHLVIVKGTEFYDARQGAYVDYPLTDVMQMIGRAGRPQFDQRAKAVLLVQEAKKDFYKKFLYESFPLESALHLCGRLADHLNAEIAYGRIKSITEAIKMVEGTYLAIRVCSNPNYYGAVEGINVDTNTGTGTGTNTVVGTDAGTVLRDAFLANLVRDALLALEESHCLEQDPSSLEFKKVSPTLLGSIAASFYISHRTIRLFAEESSDEDDFSTLLRLVSLAAEFDDTPVRHNEDVELLSFVKSDHLIRSFWERVGNEKEERGKEKEKEKEGGGTLTHLVDWSDPHVKTQVLLIAYLGRVTLPVSDFYSDTQSILEQASRVATALVEVCRVRFSLESFIQSIWLVQALEQGCLPGKDKDVVTGQLPHLGKNDGDGGGGLKFKETSWSLPILLYTPPDQVRSLLTEAKYDLIQVKDVLNGLERLPRISIENLVVKANQDHYILSMTIKNERVGPPLVYHRNHPNHSRGREEGWRIVIGDPIRKVILNHLRVFGKCRRVVELPFCVPVETEKVKLYWFSENYLGLDQEYEVSLLMS